jgi:hypothetical protein
MDLGFRGIGDRQSLQNVNVIILYHGQFLHGTSTFNKCSVAYLSFFENPLQDAKFTFYGKSFVHLRPLWAEFQIIPYMHCVSHVCGEGNSMRVKKNTMHL